MSCCTCFLTSSHNQDIVVWTQNMDVCASDQIWCAGETVMQKRHLRPPWIERRECSAPAACVSAGHMISAWLTEPPPPHVPRGEKVIAVIALPWHGTERQEVKEKDHWNDDVSELIKRDWFVRCSKWHNSGLCQAYFTPHATEWTHVVSAVPGFVEIHSFVAAALRGRFRHTRRW